MSETAETNKTGERSFLSALFILPKPGIVALVMVACFSGFYIGSHGKPQLKIMFWTMMGLGLATAGAATLNNYLDRDIDSLMPRTKRRSIPSGVITANHAYLIGTAAVTISLIMMKLTVGVLVTMLTGAAVFIYVVLYSYFLKRRTPFATHIGGVAGALPPLIGYASAKGTMDVNAFILFLIIVVWQQPHFWVLALKYREDYEKAGIPILPVVKGVWTTKVRTFWYTAVLFPVSLLPYFFGIAGVYYLSTAILVNILYLALTARFLFSLREKEMGLFFFSIFYLAVIFSAMMLDIA